MRIWSTWRAWGYIHVPWWLLANLLTKFLQIRLLAIKSTLRSPVQVRVLFRVELFIVHKREISTSLWTLRLLFLVQAMWGVVVTASQICQSERWNARCHQCSWNLHHRTKIDRCNIPAQVTTLIKMHDVGKSDWSSDHSTSVYISEMFSKNWAFRRLTKIQSNTTRWVPLSFFFSLAANLRLSAHIHY